ncbi:DUF3237 domain-containing protein [Sphingomonas bacterium]|uniref:DUF3237 domain-containing protein n=1 Tax=Sphingomonas bacterium TaxID=1895847 RepID=UPI001576A4BF|nr:DUF3237 domain-containing protein [Sphingomonas bacterium]
MELIPLCTARFDVDPPIQFGRTPTGQRSQSDIRGATFEGDRLRATLAGTASDWLILAGDIGTIDVRMALRTDDGALIGLRYTGKLDVSDPADRASRVAATFETGDERYLWLSRIQAVGKSRLERNGQEWSVHYDFYELR